MKITIPASVGELIDKITILGIKTSFSGNEDLNQELDELNRIRQTIIQPISAEELQLKEINESLWKIEDRIRVKEKLEEFDTEFIDLARQIYLTNDKRSLIKKRINELTGSSYGEMKLYSYFTAEDALSNTRKKLSDLYRRFDEQYGEWGWCSEVKSNRIIDCVLETCSDQTEPICVEIGVYGGKSLFPFALALKQLGRGRVYGIDPWSTHEALAGYDNPAHQQFWGNVDLERMYNICVNGINELDVQNFVTLLKAPSDNVKNINNISVLHIDGQHTLQLLRDIINYATNTVKGGYCFIDDIGWSEDTLKAVELMRILDFEKIEDIGGCFVYKKL